MDPVLLLFILFFGMMVLGVPIAYSLGASSLAIILMEGLPVAILSQKAFQSLDSFVLLAVPFFLIVGTMMNASTITERMLEFASAMFGKTRGALAKVNVVASMLFGGLSGSSVADVAGIGSVLIPSMIRQGYSRSFAVAITAASSTIGIIVPPSIFMAVYGAVGDVSIGALFLAGVVPGVMIGSVQMLYCMYLARKENLPAGQPFSGKRLLTATRRGILPFGVTVVIIGGIIGGIFTATEAAAVAVLYVLALAVIVYRTLTVRSFYGALQESVATLGPTLLCVAMGGVFGWVLAFYQFPDMVGSFVKGMDLSPTLILLFIMTLFVIVGTFEGGVASIIIFLPIVQPMAAAAGLDPVHVGVIVCVTLALGLITPPYGLCLFVAAKIGGLSVDRAFMSTLPFIALFIATDVLMVLFPDVVLFLPRYFLPEFMGK